MTKFTYTLKPQDRERLRDRLAQKAPIYPYDLRIVLADLETALDERRQLHKDLCAAQDRIAALEKTAPATAPKKRTTTKSAYRDPYAADERRTSP